MAFKKITATDKYIWCDFIREFSPTFDSFDSLRDSFLKSYPKVLVHIENKSGFFLKKDTQKELFNVLTNLQFTFTFNEKKIFKGVMVVNPTKIKLDELMNFLVQELPLYSSIAYKPADHNIKRYEYNTWVGFEAESTLEKVDMDLVNPLLNYILDILSDNNQEVFNFLINWLRHIVVTPWQKTGIFVFLHSIAQGTGKGSFTNWLKHYFFGNHCSTAVCGLRALTQKHNQVLMNKSFCVIDELPQTQGEFHSQFDIMKNLITEPTISVEPKGCEIFDIDNMVNFMGCSNNPYALKLEKGDRRYACIEVNDKKKGNPEYWDNMHTNVFTAEVARHFFLYLKGLEHKRLKIPDTKLRQDIISNSAPSYEQFFKNIKTGDYEINERMYMDVFETKGERITKALKGDTLYKLYESYCNTRKENCIRHRLFFNACKKYIDSCRSKINGKTVRYYLLK